MNHRLKYYYYRTSVLLDYSRSLISFIIVLFSIVILDSLFNLFYFNGFISTFLHINSETFSVVDMGFAPEVWLSLLGLVFRNVNNCYFYRFTKYTKTY